MRNPQNPTGKCAPFFLLRFGDSEAETSRKKACSSGIWNETFEFISHTSSEESPNLEIFGYDNAMVHGEFFGKSTIQLNQSRFQGWVELWNPMNPGESNAAVNLQVLYSDDHGKKRCKDVPCFAVISKISESVIASKQALNISLH
eukprot:CAMPEP_0117768548 /NCGR_PEP_ID=MMETSP0947-20121206/22450_1 /TAXON_ID=44440 /ORGANISM="Chattonella subsalsa, Strain CCMP2191" /LENGTH=144 /DNA_ID=CAMNT_0005592769 /DNA_START=201 /DNA_END=633 /DNA_ORIENTATION=-